jgi:hypothetical protein
MNKMAVAALTLVIGCASGSGTTAASTTSTPQSTTQIWPVLTRKHVDLWLHGYAMLLNDSATVPIFRRGYREAVRTAKSNQGVSTLLDANRDRLQSRLALNPAIANGQFAGMYFASFDQMKQVIGLFLQAQGNPGATNDPALRAYFVVLGSSFATAADREWLRLFTESLDDENTRFYDSYWRSQNGARLGVVRAVDSLWQGTYQPRLRGFLKNTQQENGDLILALTLGGEGRTVNFGSRQNAVAVTMPQRDPYEALYVFAHEIVSSMVNTSVTDNTTPTEQRAGTASRYSTAGAVRAGAMLLQRVAPELADGYTRFYLGQAGQSATGDIRARLASVFPLPDAIRDAIDRQLEVILGGI